MKITCSREALAREISIAQEVVSSRNSLSILSNVLLHAAGGSLTIQATDLKVGFEASIPVEVVTEGTATAFCDKMLGIVRSLPEGDVEIEQVDAAVLRVRPASGKIEFQLRCIPSDKYPELQQAPDNLFFPFPQKEFIEMVSRTLFAVSNDESRYFMNGIFMEKRDDSLVLAATDGHRLAVIGRKVPVPVESLRGVILPPKVLTIVRRLASGEGNLLLALTDKNVFVRLGERRLSSSLIDGQFPDYRRVIPDSQRHRSSVEREAFENALKRVSLLAEQKSRKVMFGFQAGKLTVSSRESELGVATEELVCDYEGPEMSFAVNCAYLTEPLHEMDCDRVAIEFSEATKAITLKPQPEEGYVNIIMPMQLD